MNIPWTAIAIRNAVNAGKITAEAVAQESLRRIDAQDGVIGAFLEVFREDVLRDAKRIDARCAAGECLPLAGVPIAIKDNMLYAGHISSAGSKMLEHYRSSYSATVIVRLQEAGAVIIGRTNMDEFAMGSSTETSAFHITKNPRDLTKVPGGSSGGSAAAVAAGMVPVSLGSDTGGSIRQPAALCGIVGMKPTYGRVSRYGVTALASSLDQIGPFATTVEDAALVLSVIEGRDVHDATSLNLDESTVDAVQNVDIKGMKIGVPQEYFLEGLDSDVEARVREALEKLRRAGAEIVNISLPLLSYVLPVYYIIQPAEASSTLARFDGLRFGTRAPGTLEESYRTARGEGFGSEVKRRIILGTFILSAGYYDAYYKKALAVRAAITVQCEAMLKTVDVLIGPTSPVVAWNIGEKNLDPLAMYLADIFTVTANITGMPAISVPCGMAHGLPVGLQIMGRHLEDKKVLHVAEAVMKVSSK